MRRPAAVVFAVVLATGHPVWSGNEEKLEGYAEWRRGELLIVDGQRVRMAPGGKFKGSDAARTYDTVPQGYEVRVKGTRLPDGVLLATEIECKPNGDAMFEGEVMEATNEMEAEWVRAGQVYEHLTEGGTEVIGRLHSTGLKVARARGIVDRLVPPYLSPSRFRVYVVENQEWNAFACANGMICVHSSMMDAMDDDEIAIVLAHELVHATHEHSRRQFKKAMWVQILALGVAAGTEAAVDRDRKKTKAVVGLAAAFSLLAYKNGYGRDNEDQADRVGLRYAHEAGFDVRQGPPLWRKFAAKYGNTNSMVNFFFGDHTIASARAVNLEREIAKNYALAGVRP